MKGTINLLLKLIPPWPRWWIWSWPLPQRWKVYVHLYWKQEELICSFCIFIKTNQTYYEKEICKEEIEEAVTPNFISMGNSIFSSKYNGVIQAYLESYNWIWIYTVSWHMGKHKEGTQYIHHNIALSLN